MSRYLRLFLKNSALRLSSEMAYKWNFWVKTFAVALGDLIGPVLILLIYSTTSGIQGWSLAEFILFQGTLTLVIGFSHVFFTLIGVQTIDMVRHGKFDAALIKPYNPLLYLSFTSFDWDGLAEIFVGLALLTWSFITLGIVIFSWNFVLYLFLIALALVLFYSLVVMISSLAFLLVKSWALFALFFRTIDFARYPLDIYGQGLRVLFTFFLPLGVASFYPAKALLDGIELTIVLYLMLSMSIFLAISLVLWHFAMKKYSSAGG
jgi:ABC-2 type transport system permease protein